MTDGRLLREGTIVADGDLPSLQAHLGMSGATRGEIVLRHT